MIIGRTLGGACCRGLVVAVSLGSGGAYIFPASDVALLVSSASLCNEAPPLLACCIVPVFWLQKAWSPSPSLLTPFEAPKALPPRSVVGSFALLLGRRRFFTSPQCLQQICRGRAG